jgi:hypothetical protein
MTEDEINKKTTFTSAKSENGYSAQTFNLNNYDSGWRVLGVKNGQIMLISADIIKPGSSNYYLYGQAGCQYGINELNAISQLYAQGTYADKSKSRSVNVNDINAITGYNPNNTGVYDSTQTGSGTKYNKGSLNEYGNEVTYYWQGTEFPYYSVLNRLTGSLTSTHSTKFYCFKNGVWSSSDNPGSTVSTSSMSEITTLTSSFYYYFPNTLTDSLSGSVTGAITTSSKAYDLLFANTSSKYYWLASSYVSTETSAAAFGMFHVKEDRVSGLGSYYSYGSPSIIFAGGVRPVVYLSSGVWIDNTDSTKDGSSKDNAYELTQN